MSNNERIRVGVIGPGGAGRGNTLAFATRDDVNLIAAADTNEDSLDALENSMREQIEGYKEDSFKRYLGDYEFIDMLNNEDLDIVGIFSPHSLHDLNIRYALRAGCSVMVEKPMANHVGDAIAVTKMAMGRDLHLVIGYQRHYSNMYLTGRQAVLDGLIGDIEKFDVYLAQRWGAGGWRGDPRFSGGGQPNDSGSHLQDIFLWITGFLPKKLHGTTDMVFEDDEGNVVPKFVEINSDSEVTMDNGATGRIKIVGNTQIGFEEWVILEGSEGKLEIKSGVHYTSRSGETQELLYDRPEGYPESKVDQIIGLVKGDYDTNYTSGINGIRTAWLTNSIIEAGKGENEWNTVDCDLLVEQEGYDREYVHNLIKECESKNMY